MAKKKTGSFENLLEETEALVEALESGELPLEDALEKYEKGVANLRQCTELIRKAEEKVKVLIQETDGAFRLDDFEEEEEE